MEKRVKAMAPSLEKFEESHAKKIQIGKTIFMNKFTTYFHKM